MTMSSTPRLPTPFGTGRLERLEAGGDIAATPSVVMINTDDPTRPEMDVFVDARAGGDEDEDDLLYAQAMKMIFVDDARGAIDRAGIAVEEAKLTALRATAARPHHQHRQRGVTPPSAIAIDFGSTGSSAATPSPPLEATSPATVTTVEAAAPAAASDGPRQAPPEAEAEAEAGVYGGVDGVDGREVSFLAASPISPGGASNILSTLYRDHHSDHPSEHPGLSERDHEASEKLRRVEQIASRTLDDLSRLSTKNADLAAVNKELKMENARLAQLRHHHQHTLDQRLGQPRSAQSEAAPAPPPPPPPAPTLPSAPQPTQQQQSEAQRLPQPARPLERAWAQLQRAPTSPGKAAAQHELLHRQAAHDRAILWRHGLVQHLKTLRAILDDDGEADECVVSVSLGAG